MIQGSFLIKNKSGEECIPNHKEGREQRGPYYWYSPYSFLISPGSTILSLASKTNKKGVNTIPEKWVNITGQLNEETGEIRFKTI